jgi:hypothetical protein
MEERNIALVILGIIAVIAIVGLILTLTISAKAGAYALGSYDPFGSNVYGGDIRYPVTEHPYAVERGRPTPDLGFPEVKTVSDTGKRSTVPYSPFGQEEFRTASEMTACPQGIFVQDLTKLDYYLSTGRICTPHEHGFCCETYHYT